MTRDHLPCQVCGRPLVPLKELGRDNLAHGEYMHRHGWTPA